MYDSVIDGDVERAVALAEQALRDGVAPLKAIDEGFVPGLPGAAAKSLVCRMCSGGFRRRIVGRDVTTGDWP